ncbi:flagellar biosynthesis protein FlaG [Chryseomicrobium excrementi]|uniref:Flagellar biosynthesis protein FlaG n=1 Tax=Chryseomicrobium excrementi TaxID=2041346 RepID=A0A2M9F0N5_9BACL|nr:flagellar protein FlaG [Chryseomicrobium excrementi]PJK17023.1 flagellar biosynthesis protein FlaG [Chryseomicrobium excrementi]
MDIQALTFPETAKVAENAKIDSSVKPSSKKFLEKEQEAPSKLEVEERINQMNHWMAPHATEIRFQLHEKLNDYFVQVIDPQTEEVLREIPSRKVLDYYAAVAQKLGLLVDERY